MAEDLDPSTVSAEFINEGGDWLAIFNPSVPRQMDVQLARRFLHEGVVCSVKFSSDNTLLAVGSENLVILYNLALGEKITFPLDNTNTDGSTETPKVIHARSVAISPDGQLLAAGSEDKLIRFWSIPQRRWLSTLQGHNGEVYAVTFSPDGHLLVSASGDCFVRVWDVSSLTKITDESGNVPDATEVSCRILRPVAPGSKLSSKLAVISVAIDKTGQYVASGSLDGVIRIWDIQRDVADPSSGTEPLETLRGHDDGVYGVQFADGTGYGAPVGLISASLDRTLKRWEIRSMGENAGTCTKSFQGHKDCVLAASVIQIGREQRLASSSRDGTVRVWDLKSGVVQFIIQGHKNTVTTVDFTQDGKLLASGSGDREVRIWRYSIL
ncbi:WD40-repeat-containing domain protein [Hygrophoropsis aurantiaca]|uniref:WD40-repeat-containing domain protein n=1 Tax=Hygrophoropsis aurantiaca TaxID=72124 RepID=A0ACB8AGR6_9AGAM|nr:WD40-repeat-containing domain protein [Hygrophoropsis aurantiaca]